jgi:ATP-dependent DNA helicase RecG
MNGSILRPLLKRLESQYFEHKSGVVQPESIAATVCAMLNTDGGTVLVEATPGEKDPSAELNRLKEHLLRAISPKALWSATLVSEPSACYLIEVPAGSDRPYVAGGTIYVRVGDRTQQADASTVQQFVRAQFGDSERWERRLIPGLLIRELDAESIRSVVDTARKARNYEFKQSGNLQQVLMDLSLSREGQVTNAGEVLFGKAPMLRLPQVRVRATVFASDKGGSFVDNRVFEGHAFEMMDSVFKFVRQHTPVVSSFPDGSLKRKDRIAYPEKAVREGLVNAFVHRDYSAFDGGMAVNLYPGRLVIWNSGALPAGMTAGDLKKDHPSKPRNPDIAHVFFLSEYMERVGRGTQKIVEWCKAEGLPSPTWKSDESGVTLTFFAGTRGAEAKLNLRQKQLLKELRAGAVIKPPEYYNRFTVSERQGRRDLGDLVKAGWLVREGDGPATQFRRTEAVWSE